jgi:hypothetical protein
MTPEQLALLQAGAEEVYDPRLRARVLAGELPPEALNPRGATTIPPRGSRPDAKQFAADALGKAKAGLGAAGQFLGGMPTGRLGMIGGMVAPAFTAVEEATAGRPTGALGALGGGAAGVAAGAAVAKMLPGPYGKIAGALLPALGGMLGAPAGAQASESIRQKVTGEPTKGKEGEFSTQMAIAKQMGDLNLSQYRTSLGVETSNIKDLSKYYSDQAYYDLQRNIPLINQIKNADLVRQQALLNTQGQLNARLGVLATAGSMAQRGQDITGQTVLTAMQTNPYAGATLQAPQIRFG